MAQALLGYCIVATAALYVAWKFMPAAWRHGFAARLGAVLRSRGLARDRVVSLQAKLSRGGACGSCDSCNACGSARRVIEPAVVRMVPNATRPPEA